MAHSLLITQCLQQDFVGLLAPHAPLPNRLHIGQQEAERLLGPDPQIGPLAQLMGWARQQASERLSIVHVLDWHDPDDPEQRDHLAQFGAHCLMHTPGAELAGALAWEPRPDEQRIFATGLNDFQGTRLPDVMSDLLAHTPRDRLRVGVIGVWTDAKLSFLLYDLKTRLGIRELATCSALTASASRIRHFQALDSLRQLLGVSCFDSVGDFAQWLTPEAAPPRLFQMATGFGPQLQLEGTPLEADDAHLVGYLYRDSAKVHLTPLSGGFSGARVFRAAGQDAVGHDQAPSVVKLGPRALIAQERTAFEQVESILGNEAPHVRGFVDLGERAGIKYAFAGMGGGPVRTIKSLFADAPLDTLTRILTSVFDEILGRFYAAAQYEALPLLTHYGFSPSLASHVRRRVADILGPEAADLPQLRFGDDLEVTNLCRFYDSYLTPERLAQPEHHYASLVHGDLNGANILIDSRDNVWVIDFFHTARGHVLKDVAKFENDLLYLFTPLADERDLAQALWLTRTLAQVQDLRQPLPELPHGVDRPQLVRAWHVLSLLRGWGGQLCREDRDPLQLATALLRYAAHTLSFDEASPLQKRWALAAACLHAEQLAEAMDRRERLWVDWVPARRGRLGLTLLPGRVDRGRKLAEDLDQLQALGATHVVTLVSDEELNWAGVPDLGDRLSERGLKLYRLPIRDQGVPNLQEAHQLMTWLGAVLAQGATVVMHCRAGLGRAGTMAACYLTTIGRTPEAAISEVRASRDPRAVETDLQEQFVHAFARGGHQV